MNQLGRVADGGIVDGGGFVGADVVVVVAGFRRRRRLVSGRVGSSGEVHQVGGCVGSAREVVGRLVGVGVVRGLVVPLLLGMLLEIVRFEILSGQKTKKYWTRVNRIPSVFRWQRRHFFVVLPCH